MTHHPVKELEDGTRVYSNYTKYVPVPDEQRKYKRRKPAVEGAVRMGGTWFHPLALLPGDQRLWPETRPDTDAYLHASKPRRCKCAVCKRPEARVWRLRGLRSAEPPPGL
jgi:hypothetical protein